MAPPPPPRRFARKTLGLAACLVASHGLSFSLGKYSGLFASLADFYVSADLPPAPPCEGNATAAASPLTFDRPSPHLWADVPLVPPHRGRKTVLVTGAAGFVGSHVAVALLRRGDAVVAVDEMNDAYDVAMKERNLDVLRAAAGEAAAAADGAGDPDDVLTIYRGDVNNGTLMDRAFAAHRPGWVVHLAARAGVRPSIADPGRYVRANVEGTTSVLEHCRRRNVTNVVVASSSSVYGARRDAYFSEAADVNGPVSPYAATKRAGELMSSTYHHLYGMNITNLRFFTVYGPRGRPDMAPYMFVDRVRRGLPVPRFGDGTTRRDYTYVDDIVDGVLRSVDRAYPCQVINLGRGSGTSLAAFIDLVARHVGRPAEVRALPAQPGDVPFTNADVSKARRLLGYAPRVSTDEGVRRTVAWFREAFGEEGRG